MFATIIRRTAIKHSAARFFSTRNAAGNIFFSKDHEYIKIISPGVGYVGISDHAQEALGELVYVDTPAVVRIPLQNCFSKTKLYGRVMAMLTVVNNLAHLANVSRGSLFISVKPYIYSKLRERKIA